MLVQDIIARRMAAGVNSPGETAVVKVDRIYLQDGNSPTIARLFREHGFRKVFDPERVGVFFDHSVIWPNAEIAGRIREAMTFCEDIGVRVFRPGDGISHVVAMEEGWFEPGSIVLGTDSHTCTGGANQALALGMGASDVVAAMITGETWLRVPETVRLEVVGTPSRMTRPKDVMLHVLATFGQDPFLYKSVEWCGDWAEALSDDGAATVANMAVEMGAKCAFLPPHGSRRDHLRKIRPNKAADATHPQSAFALRKTTRKACERIARRAFEIARRRRGKVTAVHKVNVLVLTDGLFLEACRSAAGAHPDVVYEEELVDACAAHLVRAPGDYDVIVTTNLFGDILSNEAAQVAGSLGLAASLNHGANHGLAQAAHGSAPDIAGQDKANPASMLNSLVLLLSWMGEVGGDASLVDGARVLETVVRDVLGCASFRPPDMGGVAGTSAIQAEILRRVERLGLA